MNINKLIESLKEAQAEAAKGRTEDLTAEGFIASIAFGDLTTLIRRIETTVRDEGL